MELSDHPRAARRSAGEWVFQLTTITIGVLIALSFDAVLKWNADRRLVDEALATIALEVADNRRELTEHVATFDERMVRLDVVFKLLDELDAGTEPTVREIDFTFGFPSLNDAAWESAERTGAVALLEYAEVQRLAQLYSLQSPPTVQLYGDVLRDRLHDVRAHVALDDQLSGQLLDGYEEYLGAAH